MTKYYKTAVGEVWQDSEGCMMTSIDESGEHWFVFGVATPIRSDHGLVVHPLSKLIDVEGNILDNKLKYPNGKATRN